MKPVTFKEQNITYGKGQQEYNQLPAYLDKGTETGETVTCWELSNEELEEIIRTKRVWLSQLSFYSPLQPVLLSVSKPDCIKEGKVKCPECLKNVSQYELNVFGGLCEDCSTNY